MTNGWMAGRLATACVLWLAGGATAQWVAQPSGSVADLRAVSFVDTRSGWAAGENETVLRTTNGGADWEEVRTGVSNDDWLGVSFIDADQGTKTRKGQSSQPIGNFLALYL